VPVLPYIFDHPIEKVTEHAFDWVEAKIIAYEIAKKGDKI
jgi:fission process protein 1